jgi:hypothetical protein
MLVAFILINEEAGTILRLSELPQAGKDPSPFWKGTQP